MASRERGEQKRKGEEATLAILASLQHDHVCDQWGDKRV
jgi:hypothetical protein